MEATTQTTKRAPTASIVRPLLMLVMLALALEPAACSGPDDARGRDARQQQPRPVQG